MSKVRKIGSLEKRVEELEKRIIRFEKAKVDIRDFSELSVRTRNVLLSCGINTVEDLMEKTIFDLLLSRNVGEKTLGEIIGALSCHGLELRAIDWNEKWPRRKIKLA